MTDQLRVVAVANRFHLTPEQTGDPRAVTVVVSAPPPARHHNLFAIYPDGPYPTGEDSGFLLSDGSYANRKVAASIALMAGQIHHSHRLRGGELYSEDLW